MIARYRENHSIAKMESARLHFGSIIPVLLTVLLVLQAVTGQQCNCNNQKMQGNDKLNGFLLNKFNQLRDNPNLNVHGQHLQLSKQSMPSMGSLSQASNTQKNMQGEMQIPISSFRITNGNSDSAQNGPSLNLGLPPKNSPANNNGVSGLKINQFQFIPNTPCNQKSKTSNVETQMFPIPLAISPTASDTAPCQNQGFQAAPCAQTVPQASGNCGSNFIVPQNLNAQSSETQPGQVQNQPQVVYVVLPPQSAPAPAPQYNPPIYYTPASSPSKSLSMKSLLPLLLEMLQEKNNCGCQNCPHCGSPVNQDPSLFGSYANKNLYGPTENNNKQVPTEQPKVQDNTSSEVIEQNKELAEKSAALTMPKDDSVEHEVEKSSEYLEPEFEDESLEDLSIEKE